MPLGENKNPMILELPRSDSERAMVRLRGIKSCQNIVVADFWGIKRIQEMLALRVFEEMCGGPQRL
jgi:hypothetical protein